MKIDSIVASLVVSLLGSRGNQVNRKETIANSIVTSIVSSRGNQTRRKDRDLMRDTEGISKTLREPEQKPQRDDMRVRYRTKTKTRDEWDVDTDEDKDFQEGASCQE